MSGISRADAQGSAQGSALGGTKGGLEFLVGLLVLIGLAALLAFALLGSGRKAATGYEISARFPHIDGLEIGSPVKLAGVQVGQVTAERIDPKSFQAVVRFSVANDIHLPEDSAAIITSDSLLGGKYLALNPGGSETVIKPGGQIDLTQGSISLEQLLSKFIFSVTDAMSSKKGGAAPASGAAPAVPATQTPATQTAPAGGPTP